MTLPLLVRVVFVLFFLISLCKSNQIRNVKVMKNVEFQNKKIEEIPKETFTVRSKMDCTVECKKSPSCLSFSFNDDSKVCYLYDQDFIHVAETLTTDEMGWNYYYIVPGNTLNKSKCELPATGICQSFCFFYKSGFSYDTVQDFIQACAVKGGKVIKVDRYLKQYCMEQAVGSVIGSDMMTLNGIQDETTGKWTYFNGTNMTYFKWDLVFKQPEPDYVSPNATPGKYQGMLGTRLDFNYQWHDVEDWRINGVLCEIK